jgi:glycosyltransferase involved in cell wall biosynthesis
VNVPATHGARLTVDVRLAPSFDEPGPGERVVTLRELLGTAARPVLLRRLLRADRYTTVRVRRDARPLSGVQAVASMLAGVARSGCFEIDSDGSLSTMGAWSFRVRAVVSAVAAVAVELTLTVVNGVWAASVGRARWRAPGPRGPDPRSVAFIRGEPSLSWAGAQVGGVATHTSGIVNGLTDQGIDVRVLAVGVPDGLRTAATTTVPLRRVFQLVFWLSMFAYSRDLARAGRSWPADVVMQHHALGSYAGLALAKKLGSPFVLLFHGSDLWAEKHWAGRRVLLEHTAESLERRVLEGASLVVVVSDALREELVGMGIDDGRILVNPSGVDVDGFSDVRSLSPREWRRRLGRDPAPTVGFVGTFAMFHGVTVLPAMAQAVAERRPDVRWLLIGDGPMREEVAADFAARGLEDRVELTGIVLHSEAVELLAACDVCVSPHVPNPDGSRFFGSPTKLFEYMGLGKPIVASDLEQIGEVLDHERSALLCEPGDAEAAAAAVVRLLDDPEFADRLGDAALNDAVQLYSWRAHTRRILDAVVARGGL